MSETKRVNILTLYKGSLVKVVRKGLSPKEAYAEAERLRTIHRTPYWVDIVAVTPENFSR